MKCLYNTSFGINQTIIFIGIPILEWKTNKRIICYHGVDFILSIGGSVVMKFEDECS